MPPDEVTSADTAYWAELYRRHRQAMWAAAAGRLGRDTSHLGHSAGSIVQEVMRRLMARGTVLAAANPEAYLVAAVKNLATDVLRQEARRRHDRVADEGETEEVWEAPSTQDVTEEATNAVLRDETLKVLRTMQEGPREAFVLRVMQGHTFTAVGRAMGISDVHARRLCQQALRQIQKELGIGPTNTGEV